MFEVLNAVSDRSAWMARWEAWPEHEPAAHPAYAELFAAETDVCSCAVYESAAGVVLFPFIERPLSALDWMPDDDPIVDLTTPYGYGGPFTAVVKDAHALATEFWNHFDAWAMKRRTVTLFARLSLFDQQRIEWPGGVVNRQLNVVRDLSLDPESLWKDFAHKVRTNINRARRAGLTCEVDTCGRDLDAFCSIYEETMRRNHADTRYFFPRSFFEALVREFPGHQAMFHARDGQGRIVSTELVLASNSHIYSFLGGTLAEAFPDRPNEFLKYSICEWGMETGRTAYVLGGGHGGEDSIFRYKHYFAPEGVVPFQVGQRVLLPDVNQRLLDFRRRHEGAGWHPSERFFPQYRA